MLSAGAADAQDVVITNALVVVGTGALVPNGAVVVRDGKIASAGPAAPAGAPGQRIDARGMTVMPGFIDAHRHIINGNDQQWFKDQATGPHARVPGGRLHHADVGRRSGAWNSSAQGHRDAVHRGLRPVGLRRLQPGQRPHVPRWQPVAGVVYDGRK